MIPAGEYKVEVAAQGFKTAVRTAVAVTAGGDSALGALKLTVGETSTTVEVSADAPLIETTQSQVTNTFSGTALTTFAGVQENEGLDNLALFVPGVVSVRDNGFSNTNGGRVSQSTVFAAVTMTSRLTVRTTMTTALPALVFSFQTQNSCNSMF